MGVSNSIFSISKVQGDSEFIKHLQGLDSYKTPSLEYKEPNAREPTLAEIYKSIELSGIKILNERLEKDEIKLKEGKNITIHTFDITDNEIDYIEDLTLRYESNNSEEKSIESISGIKTHYRILIKLASELTKFCGSLYIINPYESFFIQKERNYQEIWNEIKNCS